MISTQIAAMLGGAAAAVGDYESIATVTGASSYLEFTSIPQTYKHLQLRGSIRAAVTGATGLVFFNSDLTETNYYSHFLVGNGTAASAAAYNNPYSWSYHDGANIFTAVVIDIFDYTNTNKYKTTRTLRGWDANGSGNVSLESELWKNTAAISSIRFTPSSPSTIATYSTLSLYGIN